MFTNISVTENTIGIKSNKINALALKAKTVGKRWSVWQKNETYPSKLFLHFAKGLEQDLVPTFLANKREGPGEDIHEVREPVGVWAAVELSDVHHIILVLEHRSFVVVHIQIVGSGENCYQRWESGGLAFSVHSVSCILGLVRPDDGQKVVLLQEITACCIAIEVRTASHGVVAEVLRVLLTAKVFQRI